MPVPIMAAAAVGGLVMSGVGMYQQQNALNEQKRQQQMAAAQEGSAIQGMNAAQKDEIVNQQAVEDQRRKQMDLEYKRQTVQTVRNWQAARSMSLATATAQGLGSPVQSSALSGAYGNESGSARTQLTAGAQNYQIGNDTFDLNKKISDARIQFADYQTNYNQAQTNFNLAGSVGAAGAAAGAGMMSLGGAMISSAGTFGNVGGSAVGMIKNGLSFGTGPGSWMGGSR